MSYTWYFITEDSRLREEVEIALIDEDTDYSVASIFISIEDLLQLIRSNSLSIYYNTPIDPTLVDVLDEQMADATGVDDAGYWDRNPDLEIT